MKRSRFAAADQGDLFADARALYAVPTPAGVVTGGDFRVRQSQAISEALHESGKSRARIAMEMSEALGEPLTEHMLNAYASPARDAHDITMTRLRALIQATGAVWLLNVACEGLGVTVMAGADALYAQRGLIQRQIEELRQRERALSRITPVKPATAALTRGRR